jgi:hypothetical protein
VTRHVIRCSYFPEHLYSVKSAIYRNIFLRYGNTGEKQGGFIDHVRRDDQGRDKNAAMTYLWAGFPESVKTEGDMMRQPCPGHGAGGKIVGARFKLKEIHLGGCGADDEDPIIIAVWVTGNDEKAEPVW